MALKIIKPHEQVAIVCVKAALYGPPGIGKTSLGLSAPRPLHIDLDKSSYRINPVHQKDALGFDRWEDIVAMIDSKDDLKEYDTLVFDPVGKMLTLMNEYIGRLNGKNRQGDGTLTQKGFGVRKDLFINFVNRITAIGKHVVFIVHDVEKTKNDVTFARPDVGGSSSQDLVRELDLVGYLEAFGTQRTVSFDPTETHYGKNTIGLPPIINLPEINQPGVKNDLLTRIFEDFQKKIQTKQEMGVKYQQLLAEIANRVATIVPGKKAHEIANEVYKWLNEYPDHIWESQREGKLMVLAKAKELGLIVDPASKSFKAAPKATGTPSANDQGSENTNNNPEGQDGKNGPANAKPEGEGKPGQDPANDEEAKRRAENEKLA